MMVFRLVLLTAVAWGLVGGQVQSQEAETLLGRIVQWQYPNSELAGATMKDAATVNAEGDRTVPSVQRRTVMVTSDSLEKVLEFYKKLLSSSPQGEKTPPQNLIIPESGRSVAFLQDEIDEGGTLHLIMVNTEAESTTIAIRRIKSTGMTRIAWSQYTRFKVP